jgi:uncharacterized damage-inducible protein DinB
MDAPEHPAGPYVAEHPPDAARLAELIARIEAAPGRLQAAVAGLSESQLDTPYRNWTLRQIVHHLADSHVHSYIRFKWALTEDRPTIKPYDEGLWASLPDSRSGPIDTPLALLAGLHARWVLLLRSMKERDFARSFVHPATGREQSLGTTLGYYAWHGQHHTAQILWRREERGRQDWA